MLIKNTLNIAVKGEQSLIFSSLETTDSSNSIINSGEGYALPSAFHSCKQLRGYIYTYI